jgi:hypothetical protein
MIRGSGLLMHGTKRGGILCGRGVMRRGFCASPDVSALERVSTSRANIFDAV